ncbi:MAG: hypothetical protein BWY65_01457 [Firmicutes bacterium ADurb.Bin373]|nr:MAG: hypothetical protein BWY65_01457 [Firmicutes bacterium ADurb.Bin373]
MQALKISYFRSITRFHEGVKAGFHQLGDAAAEHCLLAKEVGLGLFLEGGLKNARPGPANTLGISQADVLGFAAVVLVNRDQAGHAFTFRIHPAHNMSRSLGGYHKYIDIGGRHDLAEMDVKPVGKHERVAFLQVRLDLLLVDSGLQLVGDQDLNDVSHFCRLGHSHYLEPVSLCLLPVGQVLAQSDNYIKTAVLEVLRLGVSLAAVPNNGDGFTFQQI